MKRTNDSTTGSTTETAQPAPNTNRRALLQHHDPALLADPAVVSFLDAAPVDPTLYRSLESKFVRANEPALLLELARATGITEVMLVSQDANHGFATPLQDGLFDHIAEHINQAPSVTSLQVTSSVLTAATCAHLQTSLASPACRLTTLEFAGCTFADPQVQFPTHAPTITSIDWTDDPDLPPPAPIMNRVMLALDGWAQLKHLCLISLALPLDFNALTRLLRTNRQITSLYLVSEVVPMAPGHPAHRTQEDPALLFDLLKDDLIGVTHLTFEVLDTHNPDFNDYCLQHITRCLMSNTTLELLEIPGITMSTGLSQQHFANNLTRNRTLISLAPLDIFGDQVPAPIRRNKYQRFWFTRDFVLGGAQALLRMAGSNKDIGSGIAPYMAPTSTERAYCGALMACVCKTTNQNAVRLRSAGLREAIKIHMLSVDPQPCLDLVNGMLEFHIELLPDDKLAVVTHARNFNRMGHLPAGYAH